jgi:hypothetical protein
MIRARSTGSSAVRTSVVAALLIAVAAFTGCSVPTTGVTGIGIDEDGGLVGYVQMCSGRIDGTTLYETDGRTLGNWNAPGSVTDFAKWTLGDPGDWTATQRYVEPTGEREYNLFGGTKDNSTASYSVTFLLQDVERMTPGEVRYGGSIESPNVVVSEAEFRRHACDDW